MSESDLDLIKGIKGGAFGGFERLVKRYQNPLFNFIYRYLGDRLAAEDLTQETFLRIYTAAPQFEPRVETKVSTWIFKIAYNLALNEIKRQRRLEPLGDLHSEQPEPVSERLSEELEGRDLERKIMSALVELPENQKAALLLRVNEELSYREISEVLGVSISSVESLIFRARRNLRQSISKQGRDLKS